MNTPDNNRTNMIRTTCSYCDGNTAATTSITKYALVVTAAKNKLVIIDGLDKIASGDSKGVTLDTNALRNVMMEGAAKICAGLTALAGATGNNTLAAGANYTVPKLKRIPKDQVDDVCEGITDLGTANPDVKDYGVPDTDITDTITAIGLYRTAMQNPRQNIITRKQAGDQIHPIIMDVINNLFKKQLDKMTDTLKTSNNNYYKGYYAAREIINIGTQGTAVKGSVKIREDAPSTPIYPATITISSDQNNYTIKTDINGNFSQKVKPGTYTGVCKATGFIDELIKPSQVKLGKTVVLNILMTKA